MYFEIIQHVSKSPPEQTSILPISQLAGQGTQILNPSG